MTEFETQGSDGAQIKVDGELVHSDRFEFTLNDQITRMFDFGVYAIDGGGFVVAIEFASFCSGEESVKVCEEADNLDHIEKFFYVFDVVEQVRGNGGLDRFAKDERADLSKRLAKEYEKHMYVFLDEVAQQISQHGFSDRVKSEDAGSIWSIFKTK